MNSAQLRDETFTYNMKAVARETGLNPITIRTWEQRYGLPHPHRSEGGHRQYTQRDIDTLKWLVARQEEGLSIRHAIETWRALEAQGQDPLRPMSVSDFDPVSGWSNAASNDQIDELREQWIAACMAFEREEAEKVLTQAFSYFPPEIVCMDVLRRGVVEIGKGWYEGQATVQQEHFAIALAVRRLEALVAATPQPLRPGRVLVFCAPDDHHSFGPLLLTFLLLRRGLDVVYLGANVPVEELSETVAQIEPKLVIISAQRLDTAANLLDVAEVLKNQNITVGYGGLIFNYEPRLRNLIPGHFLGETLEGALRQVETLLTTEVEPVTVSRSPDMERYRRALQEFTFRRTMMESHIWGTFITNNKSVDHLMQINADFAQTLMAALKFSSMELLGQDGQWVSDLLISYRPSEEFLRDYLQAYHQAAQIHLGEPGTVITEWLTRLVDNLEDG